MITNWHKLLLAKQEINTPEARADFNMLQTVIAVALIGSISTLFIMLSFRANLQALAAILLLNALQIAGFVWLRMRILFPARIIAPISLYITVTFLLLTGSGLHDISLIAYGGIIVVSSLTLGRRATFVTSFAIVITVFVLWWLETTGAIVTDASFLITTDDPFLISIVALAIGFAQAALITRMNTGLSRARENEMIHLEAKRNLRDIQFSLDQRVRERTAGLEMDETRAEKRAQQFELVTVVIKRISRTRHMRDLLPLITETIGELFGFYHVAIFLTDPTRKLVILSASNSEGGKRMLARGDQLRIGEPGLIGYVTSSDAPRIDLDLGPGAVVFDNPDLSETRSEIALPLKIEKQVVGALDIQTTEPNAFSEGDVEVLSVLADQVSLAIENSQWFERTQAALTEAEAVSSQNLRKEWGRLPDEQELFGYKYSIAGTTPLQANERPTRETKAKNTVAVPILLRGETIGTLTVQVPSQERISSDQIDLIKAVAERVAFSAENARLFNETQKRAERERLITEITSKIGTSVRTETILKTTAKELNQLLDGAEVLIKLKTDK
jgi:GAF domain-containing protein